MAEIIKWKANQVYPIIKHNMRSLEDGYKTGNESIHPEETKHNFSLLKNPCGSTCKEINNYRKEIGKKIHRYNRKGLVEAVEIVIQKPNDLKDEQREDFYRACHDFVCTKFLGGHEEFVFVSEVHTDEHYIPTSQLSNSEVSSLSHEHLHIMFVPAVATNKFTDEGYQFKLSAHELTSKKMLHSFHPELQAYLNAKHIEATIYQKKKNEGKTIGLPVKFLKELTEKYGIVLNRSVTLEEFAEIISNNTTLAQQNVLLQSKLFDSERHYSEVKKFLSERISTLKQSKHQLENELYKAHEKIHEQELKMNSLSNEKKLENTEVWGNSDSWCKENVYEEENAW